jgi:hypothetical protein
MFSSNIYRKDINVKYYLVVQVGPIIPLNQHMLKHKNLSMAGS